MNQSSLESQGNTTASFLTPAPADASAGNLGTDDGVIEIISMADGVDESDLLLCGGEVPACEIPDPYLSLYEMNDDIELLEPGFANFVQLVRTQFETFLVDVDPACRVTWQTANGGFDLFVFGMTVENRPHVCAAIAGDSSLLTPNGIDVVHVNEADSAVHVFVPYYGQMTAESDAE